MAPLTLTELINQPGKLPTIPKLGQQLIASFSDDDADLDDLARQLGADPALSAKLLRLANSAYFHVSRSIATVPAAIQMLGFVMVRNLVLGASVAQAFPQVDGVDLKAFWRYSLYSGCVARWLAPQVRVNGDLAFTLGLIHAVGQLHVHRVAPEQSRVLDVRLGVLETGRAAAERSDWGYNHLDVTAELARSWNFPPAMVSVLGAVARADQGLALPPEAAVLALAGWRARADVLGWDDDARQANYPSTLARDLGVTVSWFTPVAADAEGDPSTLPPLPELTEGMDSLFA